MIQYNYVIMGKKNKFKKQIGTYAEFCAAKKRQTVKESSEHLSVDVPFWSDAIESILDSLRINAGDPIDWRTLVDYVKVKFLVIDREVLGTDEDLVIAHIRDLLFQQYGDTFLDGDFGCITYDNAEMGTKALVISQLASEILRRVRIESGLEPPPSVADIDNKPVATVTLETGWGDDDFLQYEQRRVAGFNDFANRLKENVDRIRVQDDGRCLDYCLNKIEKEAGSIKLDDIMKAVKEENTTLKDYLIGLAEGYMKTASVKLNESKARNKEDQIHVFSQAKIMYAHEVARKVMEMIDKKTRKGDEKVK